MSFHLNSKSSMQLSKFHIWELFFNLLIMSSLNYSFTQINTDFVRHLSDNNLKTEHWQYITNQSTTSEDSIDYFKAKFYLQYSNDSLFLETFDRCSTLFTTDTTLVFFTSLYFLKQTSENRAHWFDKILKQQPSIASHPIFETYFSTKDPTKVDTSNLPDELKPDFLQFKKAFKKRPWIAASFSTVVPGLGKFYIGNYKTGTSSFLSLSLLGLQSAESIVKLGIKHPLSLIDIGFFSTFYISSIVGAYLDTNAKKKETKNQYLIHASTYYSTVYQYSLY